MRVFLLKKRNSSIFRGRSLLGYKVKKANLKNEIKCILLSGKLARMIS